MSINRRDYPPMPGGANWPNVEAPASCFADTVEEYERLRTIEEGHSIPEHLLAIADEAVRMELLRARPERCEVCRPGDPCFFHRSWRPSPDLRRERGE